MYQLFWYGGFLKWWYPQIINVYRILPFTVEKKHPAIGEPPFQETSIWLNCRPMWDHHQRVKVTRCPCCVYSFQKFHTWRFPKGVPLVIIHFRLWFSLLKPSILGYPHFQSFSDTPWHTQIEIPIDGIFRYNPSSYSSYWDSLILGKVHPIPWGHWLRYLIPLNSPINLVIKYQCVCWYLVSTITKI